MPAQIVHHNSMIIGRLGRIGCLALLAATLSVGAGAEEDPYLSAISSEAEKVDAMGQPTLAQPETSPGDEAEGASLQAFEEDLKTRYKGSYVFYQKLPPRTREAVYQEYRDGASIDEIRKKIMDQFLKQ